MTYGSAAFIQDGALAALSATCPRPPRCARIIRRRAGLLSALLREAPGCRVIPPEGGMFVLLDVRGSGLTAGEFALRLLQREAVAVLPCDGFGQSAAGHLRIALSAPKPRPKRPAGASSASPATLAGGRRRISGSLHRDHPTLRLLLPHSSHLLETLLHQSCARTS
jgi:arginine:pyruvate transaminase